MLHESRFGYTNQISILRRASEARCISFYELPDIIGVNRNTFFKSLRSTSGLKASEIAKVCNFFDITLDSFLMGEVDIRWIERQTLPEKYFRSKGSRFRTSLPALEYAKEIGGEAFLDSIRRTLKIPRQFLTNPERLVSIELLSDILAFMAGRGLGIEHFLRMGWKSVSLKQNAAIGNEFAGLSRREVFEKLFDEVVSYYEYNFDYRILRASSNDLTVRVTPKPERTAELKSHRIDNVFVSHYRHSVAAAHLKFAGYPIAQSELLSVASDEGQFEEFRLAW